MSVSPKDSRFPPAKSFLDEANDDDEGPILNEHSDSDARQQESDGEDEGSEILSTPDEYEGDSAEDVLDGQGFAGPSDGRVVKPLTPEALAAFNAAQERAGVLYISRIPPGMRPTKVRHLMSAYGEVGRVYLQQEDPKRAYLRKKFTATKKAHFTEGWVEFADKRVARSIAEMLNAQPIGGKKGTRWRDDVWTMKYLPRFKWNVLTEAIAHEAAERTARLRVELEQSRKEQKDYLHNVELARVLDKRAKRKKQPEVGEEESASDTRLSAPHKKQRFDTHNSDHPRKGRDGAEPPRESAEQLQSVLGSIF